MQEGALKLIAPTAYAKHCTLQQCGQGTAVTKKSRTKELQQFKSRGVNSFCSHFQKKKSGTGNLLLLILEIIQEKVWEAFCQELQILRLFTTVVKVYRGEGSIKSRDIPQQKYFWMLTISDNCSLLKEILVLPNNVHISHL